MEFTIFQRGSGMRYVGDHVGSIGEWDCVLQKPYFTEVTFASGWVD
jgi:hypothetical protein